MQKSAAEARNKNRSGLCFDYQPSAREVTKTAPKKAVAAKGGAAKKEAKPVEKAVSSEKPGLMELEFGKGGRGVSIELSFKFGRCIDTTKKTCVIFYGWFFVQYPENQRWEVCGWLEDHVCVLFKWHLGQMFCLTPHKINGWNAKI